MDRIYINSILKIIKKRQMKDFFQGIVGLGRQQP
jgi:hypothetical protein